MSSSHTNYSMPRDVVFQSLDDESVLLNLQTERYYVLNDVATRMWQLLTEHGHYDAALARVLVEFEVDEATARRDMDVLIARLTEMQLLAVAGAD